MEQKINALNIDVAVFLHKLRSYSHCINPCIGKKTITLLMDAVSCIDELVVKANDVDVQENSIDHLDELDERHFDVRHNIMCRLCFELISASKDDFQTHIRKAEHIFKIQDAHTPPLQHLPEQRPFKPSTKSWQIDQSQSIAHKSNVSFHIPLHDILNSGTEESLKEFKKTCESASQDCTRYDYQFYKELQEPKEQVEQTEQMEQNKAKQQQSMEHVIDAYWKGVRVHESSTNESDSSYVSIRDFNFDSKYLIEVQNLPCSASRKDIVNFFTNVHILNGSDGIHFVLDDTNRQNDQAFIQLEQLADFQLAQSFNMKRMGDHHIRVLAADLKWFNDKVTKRKIPSKDSCVLLNGLPQNYNEQDIHKLFHDLLVERISIIQNSSKTCIRAAYVKFSMVEDVEIAIKRNDKQSGIRILRTSNIQMKTGYNVGPNDSHESAKKSIQSPKSTQSSQHSTLQQAQAANIKTVSEFASDAYMNKLNPPRYVKVRGLERDKEKDYVINLFQGLRIDRNDGVQMEKDMRGCNTGVAFVEFKYRDDYNRAVKMDLKNINGCMKVHSCTKAEFIMNKDRNY